ncbi:MAG: VanZ family protein [Candidatus Omnitrophota bacterium]
MVSNICRKTKENILAWLPAIIWAGGIFYASSLSLVLKPQAKILFADKIIHFFIYLPLGFFVARALWLSDKKVLRKNLIVLTVLICFLYGFSDEIHQLFVPCRQFSLWDAFSDILGSLAGIIIFKKIRT